MRKFFERFGIALGICGFLTLIACSAVYFITLPEVSSLGAVAILSFYAMPIGWFIWLVSE